MIDQLKRYEFKGEYDMIHLVEVATGEYFPDSYDIEWVRADEAAAALSEAQATIARLEAENAGLKAAILALSKDAAARAAQSDGDGE